MKYIEYIFNILLIIIISTSNTDGFGIEVDEVITPTNPQFSENACIIIENYAPVDCDLAPPDRFIPEEEVNPCPGCPEDDLPEEEGEDIGLQIVYTQLEDAIDNCPYDPILIEFTGTLYLSSDPYLFYNETKDITLRGISETIEIPPTNITTLVPMNVTSFNVTTNMTMTTIEIVEVTDTIPGETIEVLPIVVGLKDWQILHQNITITMENFILEGCDTERPVFLTEIKPLRCGVPEELPICCGEYFYINDIQRIGNESVCTRTGAQFRGTQSLKSNTGTSTIFNFQEELTLELWVYPTDRDQDRFNGVAGNFYEGDDDDEDGFGFAWNADIVGDNTKPEFFNGAMWWLTGTSGDFKRLTIPTPVDQWTHIAGVWDAGESRVYVNGQLYDSGPSSNTDLDYRDDNPFRIGGGNNGGSIDKFIGLIDEVRVWDHARTESQIQALFRQTVPPTSVGLVSYHRFDKPRGTESDNYLVDLVYLETGEPELQFTLEGSESEQPLYAVPVCFCNNPPNGGTCVATDSFVERPHEAIVAELGDECDTNSDSCGFLHGSIIDPNGDFGKLWLPGLKSTSGEIFNEIVRFVPGRFFETQIDNVTMEINFIPGAVASELPPLEDGNPWNETLGFIPGWFGNDGMPPFWALNFYPGKFVNTSMAFDIYGIPTPTNFEEGDYSFVPGIWDIEGDGSFTPFDAMDPYYIMPIIDLGGFTFNETLDTDDCIPPSAPLPIDPDGVEEPPVIEDEFGCVVGPDDPEPFVIDPSQRDPCFVLRDIREELPDGTEMLQPEDILGCRIGPDDPEPLVLDPSQRDPCFILRDLRMLLNDTILNCTRPGEVLLDPIYLECLKNQNLTMIDMTVQNYLGDRVVCQHACDEYVTLEVDNSDFKNTPGNAIWSSGLHHYDVHDSNFCPCGGQTDSCVYLNSNHITRGEFVFYNNRHCAIEDNLPYTCDYDLSPTLKCLNGELLCLNVTETLLRDCQQIEITEGVNVFDSDCAIFTPCECRPQSFNVTLPNNTTQTIETATGDIIIEIPFLTPLLSEITGGNNTLIIPCQIETRNETLTYECEELVFFNVTLMNVTITMNTTVIANCTETIEVEDGSAVSVPCPCVDGFDPTMIANVTGSQVNDQLGIYTECQWDIPNGQPGEICLNGIVQCPFNGGQLGSGGPPPVGIGECSGGIAIIECNPSTCIGGTIQYEGKLYPCDLNSTACSVDGLLEVTCDCNNGELTVTCTRNECIPITPCNVTMPLCEITDGLLTFDGVDYPCFVQVNETDCIGFSYAPLNPTPPPNGQLRLPCDNFYQVPGSGPCSCLQDTTLTTNLTVPTMAATCNFTIDPNCTEPVDEGINTGDDALQLSCLANGQISCRCDGPQALQSLFGGNRTIANNSVAFHIDNINDDVSLFFQQNNVAQGLWEGLRYERVSWDVIKRFALKVLHFFTGEGVMHESARLSPLITGSVHDWVDGHPEQWNRRICNDGCHQNRPRQLLESCVVDSEYGEQTPLFGTFRFNRIQIAMDECPFNAVVIHKAENVYEERLLITRENFWLGSYDGAVIVQSGQSIRNNNITLRGLTIVHPNTDKRPLIQPASEGDDFDSSDDDDDEIVPPSNFTILNCNLFGNGVNEAGTLVGTLGRFFVMKYNTISSFFVRSVDIRADDVICQLNNWIDCTGRAFRGRDILSYIFEENLLKECVGISSADDVDIVSLQAKADFGSIETPVFGEFLFDIFYSDDDDDESDSTFDSVFGDPDLDPDMGCNPIFDEERQCYIRGNRQKVSNSQPDQSTVVYRVLGGNITVDRIRDNVASHGKYGFHFSFTPSIRYPQRDKIFKRNALIRVKDTRLIIDDGEDFAYKSPGSLVTLGCSFPDCLYNETFPPLEVNKRCNLNLVEEYGFLCINNITEASIKGLPLNLANITSGRARLRREDMKFFKNFWGVGFADLPCCDKPVFYGADHTFYADRTILEHIETRYEFDELEDSDGAALWLTVPEFTAQEIRFYNVCMDGRYTVGQERRTTIADIFMRVEDGIFVMEDSRVYNWWHYPDGTIRGYIDGEKGIVPVVALPDGTIYFTERSPDIDGIHVHFTTYKRIELSPFVVNPSEPPEGPPESMAIIRNNYFVDLDGTALWIIAPGNWDIDSNIFQNCGMRQHDEIAVCFFEGNRNSFGEYYILNNIINQTKEYLFPIGGGQGNRVWFSGISVGNFLRPRVWVVRNTTIPIIEIEGGEITNSDTSSISTLPVVTANVIEGGLFDGIEVNPDNVDPIDNSASQILNTNTNNPSNILGVGGTHGPDDVQEGQVTALQIDSNNRGMTIGIRIWDTPKDVIAKTLTPGRNNLTYFPFFQPDLYEARILAGELNSIDASNLLAEGNITIDDIPTDGPGINGIKFDILICDNYKDIMEDMFGQCTICNDGCPVQLPDSCIVDPNNGTFVPENPFFNKWLFTTIDIAVMECRDPNRIINVKKQNTPYTQMIDIEFGNWTITSDNGADFLISTPILINADYITIQNLIFYHGAGNSVPTLQPGTALGRPPIGITLTNVTFDGEGSKNSAISGKFDSLAILLSTFEDYDGARVIDVTSDCGTLFIEENLFINAQGSAIFAEEYNVVIIRSNSFIDCGGRIDGELSCVYVRVCLDTVNEITFAENEHSQDSMMVLFERTGPSNGYVSAYWIDGMPLLNTNVTIDLTNNAASGLPIGLRVTRYDDLSESSTLGDKRATLQHIAFNHRNLFVTGTFQFIVLGPPIDDQMIMDDPSGTIHLYCDTDCSGSSQSASLIITLSILFFLFLLYTWYTCRYRLASNFYTNAYSPHLEISYPRDPLDMIDEAKYRAKQKKKDGEFWAAPTKQQQRLMNKRIDNVRKKRNIEMNIPI